MSKKEIRVVCAPLSLLFFWFLIFGDTSKMTPHILYGSWMIAFVFGFCSLFGPDFGERFLGYAFGIPFPDKSEPGLDRKMIASDHLSDGPSK